MWGYPDIAKLLKAAGATSGLDELDTFLSACMNGDGALTAVMLAADPTLRERALTRDPDQLVRAAEKNSLDAVALLIDLGFDVNAINRAAPLHEAAMRGNLEMIRLLLEHGADPNARDCSYDATPAGWAEHHGSDRS
jgi:ankyrin repeat protein